MMNLDAVRALESLSDSELNRRCYRALYTNTRAHWQGSRARLRKRVRSFLRQRRNDRTTLISILRGVAASSILAVALLGLDASAALAAPPNFPFPPTQIGGFDVGTLSAPVLVDLDGDGDLDLVSGAYQGNLLYYENTGSASSPTFVERTGTANPFNGFDVGYNSTPTFADLDDDGDLDLVVGDYFGKFAYFENTGSFMIPLFVPRIGSANLFNGLDIGYYATPALADMDNDGDLDLLSGDDFGSLFYFENTGSAASAVFVAQSGPANPFDGLSVGSYAAPVLADLDNDGDPDLVVGDGVGTFAYFENTGSVSSPVFTARTGTANPLDALDFGYHTTPALADVDDDGDLDLVSGESEGTFLFLENAPPITNPNFTEAVGVANPLDGHSTAGYSSPTFADLDDDGDLDVVAGSYSGAFFYYENTGLATLPSFTERTGTANPFDGLNVGYGGAPPTLADLDGDGDLDMVSGSYYDGTFHYFENTGSAVSPSFVERTGGANPLNGLGTGYTSAPVLVDLDDDGDFDLVSGEGFYDGMFAYFENIGSALSPSFVERTGAANPLDGFAVGSFSNPTFVDFDGDLDFDLVSGSPDGAFLYFENTGSVSTPVFTQVTGLANPFVALNPGFASTPALADLNGDGGLDLLSGESTGTFVYYLPEPRGSIALAVGSWLLSLFARRKRSSRARS